MQKASIQTSPEVHSRGTLVSTWLLRTLVAEKSPSLGRAEVSSCGLTGDADELAQLQAPQSYRSIISTGDNPATILRKTDMLHARLVPPQYDRRCTRIQRIPETDRVVLTGRHQPPAVWAERYR